ncbi:sec-independent protein translocase protein TatC [Halogranum amylolyticum]|uniref:Sec-independent protein translocase protein TatC n=1 Tax=Halogranum amylolyticum TaxID=660520 RepID=A0A1H8QRB3_9EURY|nr:twin-arginine translocase subunit TatC [Halogranum amylolyticum]SEO56712.1 sec-independent protein translocase protein TatC [Halogranum amylolyticum]
MGDESESDAEPTDQLDDRDDTSPESDETATQSTDDRTEQVDDTTSDDADSVDLDATARTNGAESTDEEPTDDPPATGTSEPSDDSPSASETTVGDADAADTTDDDSEPALQPEAPGDTALVEDDEAATLEPVAADRDAEDGRADARTGDGEETPDAADRRPDRTDDAVADAGEGFAAPATESGDGFHDDFDDDFHDDFDDDFATPEDYHDDFDDVDDVDDDGMVDGPETDQEMPLADHIEEMVRRLAVVFVIGGVVALSVFGLGEVLQYVPSTIDIINFLWNKHIPGAGLPGNEDLRPHIYGPLELILTKLKVASLVGVVVGLPVFVYESYLFMRPGLYQKERKYYLASVPTSLILAVVGVAFAHFVVLPSIFAYFTSYTEGTALIAFGLSETFNLILILMGYMAIVFQIPLFIMLAIMMNLVTRQWLEDKRLIFWGSFLGLAFLVSPDPTGMAPIIIAITMVALFEGTLLLLRWTGN